MFTGIIESVGKVKAMQPVGGDIRLVIESDSLDFSDVSLGDSIASNGICLTVVDLGSHHYAVDVSRETIARTALESLKTGDIVNLEKAMLPTTRFGGHIVAGHVDGVGVTTNLVRDNIVCLNIIPHTAQVTNIAKYWLVGNKVNVEVDIVARYLERLLNKTPTGTMNADSMASPQSHITEAFLADNGFMK